MTDPVIIRDLTFVALHTLAPLGSTIADGVNGAKVCARWSCQEWTGNGYLHPVLIEREGNRMCPVCETFYGKAESAQNMHLHQAGVAAAIDTFRVRSSAPARGLSADERERKLIEAVLDAYLVTTGMRKTSDETQMEPAT